MPLFGRKAPVREGRSVIEEVDLLKGDVDRRLSMIRQRLAAEEVLLRRSQKVRRGLTS